MPGGLCEDWETLIFFVDSRALPYSYHEDSLEPQREG